MMKAKLDDLSLSPVPLARASFLTLLSSPWHLISAWFLYRAWSLPDQIRFIVGRQAWFKNRNLLESGPDYWLFSALMLLFKLVLLRYSLAWFRKAVWPERKASWWAAGRGPLPFAVLALALVAMKGWPVAVAVAVLRAAEVQAEAFQAGYKLVGLVAALAVSPLYLVAVRQADGGEGLLRSTRDILRLAWLERGRWVWVVLALAAVYFGALLAVELLPLRRTWMLMPKCFIHSWGVVALGLSYRAAVQRIRSGPALKPGFEARAWAWLEPKQGWAYGLVIVSLIVLVPLSKIPSVGERLNVRALMLSVAPDKVLKEAVRLPAWAGERWKHPAWTDGVALLPGPDGSVWARERALFQHRQVWYLRRIGADGKGAGLWKERDLPMSLRHPYCVDERGRFYMVEDDGKLYRMALEEGRWERRRLGEDTIAEAPNRDYDIAYDPTLGRLVIINKWERSLEVRDLEGKRLSRWAYGKASPLQMSNRDNDSAEIGARDGQLYLSDRAGHKIRIYDLAGRQRGAIFRAKAEDERFRPSVRQVFPTQDSLLLRTDQGVELYTLEGKFLGQRAVEGSLAFSELPDGRILAVEYWEAYVVKDIRADLLAHAPVEAEKENGYLKLQRLMAGGKE